MLNIICNLNPLISPLITIPEFAIYKFVNCGPCDDVMLRCDLLDDPVGDGILDIISPDLADNGDVVYLCEDLLVPLLGTSSDGLWLKVGVLNGDGVPEYCLDVDPVDDLALLNRPEPVCLIIGLLGPIITRGLFLGMFNTLVPLGIPCRMFFVCDLVTTLIPNFGSLNLTVRHFLVFLLLVDSIFLRIIRRFPDCTNFLTNFLFIFLFL